MRAGPLSEVEEFREADADIHSVYDVADSDLMSSDGAEQVHSPLVATTPNHIFSLPLCLLVRVCVA